jgi:site-specific DNA recombinase
MSESGCIAFYARVSSEAQARDHTIDSQIAALKERITADGFQLEPDHPRNLSSRHSSIAQILVTMRDGHESRGFAGAPDG